jgi:hypothetical protein
VYAYIDLMLEVHLPVQEAVHGACGLAILESNMLLHEGSTLKLGTGQDARGQCDVKVSKSYPCNRPWRPIGL